MAVCGVNTGNITSECKCLFNCSHKHLVFYCMHCNKNILDFLLFQRDSFLFIKNKMFCKILYLKECKYALQIVRCGNINIFVQSELFALKVVPATFLLVCFLSVKENTLVKLGKTFFISFIKW